MKPAKPGDVAKYERLLDAIKASGSSGPTTVVPGTAHVMHTVALFFAELVKDSKKQADEIITLTRKLLWLTVALSIVAAIQIALMIAQYCRELPRDQQKADKHHAITNNAQHP